MTPDDTISSARRGDKDTYAGPDPVLARNNVRVSGTGTRPLVFAHGFGCDQNMWRFVAPAFEDDFRVVRFDYVGAGRSDRAADTPERYGDLDGYVGDLTDVLDALDLREDVTFVGHSVSAMVGLLAAARQPERFHRLVLIGPSPCYLNDPATGYVGGFERADIEGLLDLMDRNYLGWAAFLAPVVMGNPDRPGLTRELEGSFCSTDPKTARRFAEVTFFTDSRADLAGNPAAAAVPALIVQCSDDAIAPRAVGEYVHRSLPGSTLHILEATGHCPHMSHPEETTRVVREYLSAAATGPPPEQVPQRNG